MFFNRGLSGPLNPAGDKAAGNFSFSNTVYWGNDVAAGFGFPANTGNASNPNEYITGTFGYNTIVVGGTVVTLTATDVYGNQEQATAMVMVKDVTGPVVVTKNINLNLDPTGHATIVPNDVLQSPVTDNCTVQSVTVSPNSFNCADYGGSASSHQAYVSNTNTGNDIIRVNLDWCLMLMIQMVYRLISLELLIIRVTVSLVRSRWSKSGNF